MLTSLPSHTHTHWIQTYRLITEIIRTKIFILAEGTPFTGNSLNRFFFIPQCKAWEYHSNCGNTILPVTFPQCIGDRGSEVYAPICRNKKKGGGGHCILEAWLHINVTCLSSCQKLWRFNFYKTWLVFHPSRHAPTLMRLPGLYVHKVGG